MIQTLRDGSKNIKGLFFKTTMNWRDFFKHPYQLFWIALAYIPWLWCYQIPLTGDQKTYLAVAHEMSERGSYLLPYLFGETNYLKPPFQYWMTILSWKIFGMNWFGSLFPSVLALLGTSYVLSEIASLLGGRRWYVSAGLWFAASLGAFSYAQAAQMDIWICFVMSLAWWMCLLFMSASEAERKTGHLVAGFIFAGLLAWIKSPLYSVFFGMSFFLYILSSGEWLLLREKRIFYSIVVGVAVASAWYVVAGFLDFDRLWQQYFIQEQFKKGSNSITLSKMWWAVVYQSFPFALLVLVSLRAIIQGRRTSAVWRFALCWIIPPALFFSLFPYKNTLYLFILVPALAILADWALFRAFLTRTYRWSARITGGIVCVLFCGAGLFAFRLGLFNFGLFSLAILAGGFAWLGLWFGRHRVFLMSVIGFYLIARLGSIEAVRPEVESLILAVKNARVAQQNEGIQGSMLDEGRDMFHDIGLVQIHLGKGLVRLTDLDGMTDHLDQGGYVILDEEQYQRFGSTLERIFEERGKMISSFPWKRFKARKNLPVGDILRHGPEYLKSEENSILRTYAILVAK